MDITITEAVKGANVTVTYSATIDDTAAPNQVITNTATLTYTSLPGANGSGLAGSTTPGAAGESMGERDHSDGVGGVDDYTDNDDATLTCNDAPGIISFARQMPATSPTSADALVFRVTFDEDVLNVSASDFTVFGTTATITAVNVITANMVYDLTVSGNDLAGLNGTVGIDLAGGQDITDTAGNALPAGEPGIDQTYVLINPGYWTGVVNTNWDNALNWDDGTVPSNTVDVLIRPNSHYAVTQQPTVNISDAQCQNLTIEDGATVTISSDGNVLTVNGNYTKKGTGGFACSNGGKAIVKGDVYKDNILRLDVGSVNGIEIRSSISFP